MAISVDTTSSSSVGVGSQSWSHTCTGSNLILYVGVWNQNASSSTVTNVTYNGVAMTRVGAIPYFTGAGCTYLYRLVAPATGTNTIAVTVSGNFTVACGASYTGASQTGQPDAGPDTQNGGGSAASLTSTIVTSHNNSWMIAAFGTEGSAPTAGTGATKRIQNASNTALGLYDTNAAITPAGSTSMTVNAGSTTASSMISESFFPVVATTVNSGFFFATR